MILSGKACGEKTKAFKVTAPGRHPPAPNQPHDHDPLFKHRPRLRCGVMPAWREKAPG